jgi:hypothetical protein
VDTTRIGNGNAVGFPRAALGLAGLLACALAASPLYAQTGAVRGRVRDETGAAVPGAAIRLLRAADTVRAGDLVRSGETDRLGRFRLRDVPAGAYTLRAMRAGYAESTRPVEVVDGDTTELDLVLERDTVEIAGITVGAERSRERVRFEQAGGATVRELPVAEIKRVPGVAEADPLRAVEVLPGVVATSNFSASFHVRGGSQDENLILLDGAPVLNPFHLGGFFSVFNADMIDRAELRSGGFSAEHGGRVSSVFQVESDPGDGGRAVDVGMSVLASRIAVSGGTGPDSTGAQRRSGVRWRGSARRSYFDWLLKPIADVPYFFQDFQGTAEAWTRGGDRIRLSAYTGSDLLDLGRLDEEGFPVRMEWDWGNDVAGLRWTHPRADGGSWDVRANTSAFDTELSFPDLGDTGFRSALSQLQARVDWEARPSPGTRVQAGGATERMAYRARTASDGTEFWKGQGTGTLLALYGQTTWTRPGAWLVEAGARWDRWTPDPGQPVTHLSPRFAAKRFFAGGAGALKVAAGRYTQYVHSLRDEDLPLGLDVWVLAGERAPPVVSAQVQAGVEGYPRENWFVSLEAYRRGFDGVASFNQADDPNTSLDDILAGTGRSWGVDLLIRRDEGAVAGWLALSVLRARRTFPDMLSPEVPTPSVTYAPVFDRTVDADLVLRYPLPWGWEGGLRWNAGTGTPYTRALGAYAAYRPRFVGQGGRLKWGGSKDDTDDLGGYAVVLEERNGSRYPAYHRLDLSARRTLARGWGTLVPYVDVLNTYDRRNVLFYYYRYTESPPRRGGISMFPFMATVGLEIHFR